MAPRRTIAPSDTHDQQPLESPETPPSTEPPPARRKRRTWDESTEQAILDLIHDGLTMEAVAREVGWSVKTIGNKRRASRSFDEAVEAALDMRGVLHAAKFDEDMRNDYLALLREGSRKHAAARIVGVDPVTVWRHTERDLDFAEQVKAAEREGDEAVEDALRKAALGLGGSGKVDTTAAIFWLTNRAPDRWQDRRNIRLGGEPGNPLLVAEEDPADYIARLLAAGGDEAHDLLDRLDSLAVGEPEQIPA